MLHNLQMRKQLKIAFPLCVLVSLAIFIWKFLPFGDPENNHPSSSPDRSDSNAILNPIRIIENRNTISEVSPELLDRLWGELQLLRQVNGEAEGQKAIQNMMTWLDSQPGASAAIASLLQTGEDAFAFGRFSPGADGFLKSYPTFRTALLDALENLDSETAISVGKEILNTSENSDEWALSLRTLARHAWRNDDRAFLARKVEDLLNKSEWLNDPSFSYLHAFDVAVAGGLDESLNRLGVLVADPPSRSVGHAAILSVDRFFQSNELVGAQHILSNPDFLDSKTGFRATLMARLDPRNLEGVSSMELYLDSGSISSAEKGVFFESFPNFNSTYSFNLVTESVILSRTEMRARSIASKDILAKWLAVNAYPDLNDKIEARLNWLANTWRLEL